MVSVTSEPGDYPFFPPQRFSGGKVENARLTCSGRSGPVATPTPAAEGEVKKPNWALQVMCHVVVV